MNWGRRFFFGREAIPDSLAFDLNLSFIRNLDQFVKPIFFPTFYLQKRLPGEEAWWLSLLLSGLMVSTGKALAGSRSVFRCFLASVDTKYDNSTAVSCAGAEKSSKQQRHVSQISFKTQVQENA